jgi:hypothetical protein
MRKKIVIIILNLLLLSHFLFSAKNVSSEAKLLGTFLSSEKACDGILETAAVSRDIRRRDQHLLLIFPTCYKVKEIVTTWSVDKFPGEVILQLSSDIIHWEEIMRITPRDLEKQGKFFTHRALVNKFAQYVRTLIPKQKLRPPYVELQEIEVFIIEKLKPEIEAVKVLRVSENTAQITWKTNIPVRSQISYGRKRGFLDNLIIGTHFTCSHGLTLEKLSSGTRYFYIIKAEYLKNSTETPLGYFITQGEPPLEFIRIEVLERKKHLVRLLYQTNVPTTGEVKYGGKKVRSNKFKIVHTPLLTGLTPGKEYYYQITARDRKGREIVSKTLTFRTAENNIALGKVREGSFCHLPRDKYVKKTPPPLSRVTDGKICYFSGMAQSGNITEEAQFIILDFGKIERVGKIKIYWRELAYPKEWSLLGSRDKKKWFVIKKGIDSEKEGALERCRSSTRPSVLTPCRVVTLSGGGKKMRYLKLFIPKGAPLKVKYSQWEFVQLMEIKVFPRN